MLNVIKLLIEDLVRGLSGSLGQAVRRVWYRRRVMHCGKNLRIEPGVHIVGAEHVSLGDNVLLDRGVVLIAGGPSRSARIVNGMPSNGRLVIGSDCHIGVGTIIQAHGGVIIGDYFTSSSGAKVYSFSNHAAQCRNGTMRIGANSPGYIVTPVVIGKNVWIGLDALVVGAKIGDDCFLLPQTVATGVLPSGFVYSGMPARSVRRRFPESRS